LVTFLAAAQNLKPIPQMVADAGSDFQKLSLFSEKAENLTAAPEIGPALRTGTVLSWDAAQVHAVRALAGNPLTLTLPMANGDVLALDLVPAKKISRTPFRCMSPVRAKRLAALTGACTSGGSFKATRSRWSQSAYSKMK